MTQHNCRAGRFAARERGAFDVQESQQVTVDEPVTPAARVPLVYVLPPSSLADLAGFCGVTVQEFVERYAVQ